VIVAQESAKPFVTFDRSIGADKAQTPFQSLHENPVLGRQIFVSQLKFLIHRARDVGQGPSPIYTHSVNAPHFRRFDGAPNGQIEFWKRILAAQKYRTFNGFLFFLPYGYHY